MGRHQDALNAGVSKRIQRAVGDRLQAARRSRNQKQNNLAVELGISRTSVSNIERGRHRIFLDQVYIAAKALGVELSDLLPPVDDIYPSQEVRTASDDPLTPGTEQAIRSIAEGIRTTLAGQSKGSTRKRRS